MVLKKYITKRRGIILALILIIIAGAFSVVNVINGIVSSEKSEEKLFVQNRINQILSNSKVFAEDYILKRKLVRDRAQENLNKYAATLVGDIQVFLQAAIVKKEADLAQKNLNDIKRKRELLAAFALQRFSSMTKEMLRLKQDVTKMQVSLDDLIRDAQEKLDPVVSISGNSSTEVTDDLPNLLTKIKNKNIENSKEFRARGNLSAKNEVIKLRELRKFLNDKDVKTTVNPITLFKELTPDIANLIPKDSVITIAEVGGKVLFSFGDIKNSGNDISSEVSRTMIFQALGESYQLIISLKLNDNSVTAKPNMDEFKVLLQNDIIRVLGTEKYSGYIFNKNHDLLMSFPETIGVRTSIPEKGWSDILAANIATFYKEQYFSLDGLSFGLGICYEMTHITVSERIRKIIKDNPGNAVLLIILAILILLAIIIICILGWRGNGEREGTSILNNLTSNVDIRSIRPELGSLKRLQKINRGHNVGGSRILDYTRNEALKELIMRVRGESSENKEELEINTDNNSYKSELREYMK